MRTKRYRVTLTPEERADLLQLISVGKAAARTLVHARVLLKADTAAGQRGLFDADIAGAVETSVSTVERVRQRFVEEGLQRALLPPLPTAPRPTKLDGRGEARLIAEACSTPPGGRDRWTLKLLADRMVELGIAESLSYETVRRTLKKTSSSPI
jgi:transposase